MIDIGGIISIVSFYLLIVAVGIWAGRKKPKGDDSEVEVMLAGRSLGLIVGVFTMTATWVAGGYVNGASEVTYSSGLIWCQSPFAYGLSLFMGGLIFAKKMRSKGYVTMLDPLQEAFGERMGGLLFLPALMGEVFWAGSTLNALAATFSVIFDMNRVLSVLISVCIAVVYTQFGGLRSVAYTDVIQLICILFGLWLTIPFALKNNAVGSITDGTIDLIGHLKHEDIGTYIDYGLLITFGGIPWQVYFQRVLSTKTPSHARILSYMAGLGCLIAAVPSIIVGFIARATNWNETSYGESPLARGEENMVLPLVMKYLTPGIVPLFGLGAISAAVMSSIDSAVLSASSLFSRNIYRNIFRQTASEKEIIWVMKGTILFVGSMASVLALSVKSVYWLSAMSSDLVYVILFPQLLLVVHFRERCNTYGSFIAFLLALVLRLGGGEELLGLPAIIHYPGYDVENKIQRFPFRTFCMLISLFALLLFSKIADFLFKSRVLSIKYDYFKCFEKPLEEKQFDMQNEKLESDSISLTDQKIEI